MAQSCTSAARSAPKRASGTYAPRYLIVAEHLMQVPTVVLAVVDASVA